MNMLRPMISSIMKNKDLEYNDFMAEYAIGGFMATVNYWYHYQESMSLQELASWMDQLMTKGLRGSQTSVCTLEKLLSGIM